MMENQKEANQVDHYGSQYGNFENSIVSAVRREAFGKDIGQTGWLTAEEQDLFINWLNLQQGQRLLDIACGSGRPAIRIAQKTGCHLTGIDLHQEGIDNAQQHADRIGLSPHSEFLCADASQRLPFEDAAFDALMCIDAINHLPDRKAILKEWRRVLKPSGVLLYTDPIIVTGPMSNEEITIRSSIGYFLFVPSGVNERMLKESQFQIERVDDRTHNMAMNAGKWLEARAHYERQLRVIEGEENFEGQQVFFKTASELAAQRRLSRFSFIARAI